MTEPLARRTFAQEGREALFRDLQTIRQSVARRGSATSAEPLPAPNEAWCTWRDDEDAHDLFALVGYLGHAESTGSIRIDAQCRWSNA